MFIPSKKSILTGLIIAGIFFAFVGVYRYKLMTETGVWQANRLSKQIDNLQSQITIEENAIIERDMVTKKMREKKNEHLSELNKMKIKHRELSRGITTVKSFTSSSIGTGSDGKK